MAKFDLRLIIVTRALVHATMWHLNGDLPVPLAGGLKYVQLRSPYCKVGIKLARWM